MFDTPEIMRLAQDLARHAGERQSQVARNIANADTPGYRARDLSTFSDAFANHRESLLIHTSRKGHIAPGLQKAEWRTVDVGGQSSPNGNTVSLEAEMVRAASANSSHDLALTVYRSSMDVLRTSLGRGR